MLWLGLCGAACCGRAAPGHPRARSCDPELLPPARPTRGKEPRVAAGRDGGHSDSGMGPGERGLPPPLCLRVIRFWCIWEMDYEGLCCRSGPDAKGKRKVVRRCGLGAVRLPSGLGDAPSSAALSRSRPGSFALGRTLRGGCRSGENELKQKGKARFSRNSKINKRTSQTRDARKEPALSELLCPVPQPRSPAAPRPRALPEQPRRDAERGSLRKSGAAFGPTHSLIPLPSPIHSCLQSFIAKCAEPSAPRSVGERRARGWGYLFPSACGFLRHPSRHNH